MSEAFRQDAQIDEQTSAIQKHARKLMIAAGAGGAAAVVFGAGGHVAHAEEVVDPNAGTIILTDKGDTIWDGQAKLGLTPEERIADLKAHGFDTYEKQAGLDQAIGKKWQVDTAVLAAKKQRELQNAIDVPAPVPTTSRATEQKPKQELDPNTLYFVLKPNETVWSDLVKAGVPEENIDLCLQYIKQTYKDVFDIEIDFNNLPVGFRYTVPLSYKIGLPKAIDAPSDKAETPPPQKSNVATPPPKQPAKPAPTPPPAAPPAQQPQNQVTPPSTTTPTSPPSSGKTESIAPRQPEVKEPQTIYEVLQVLREQYKSGGAEIAPMVAFVQKNFKHPEINPANGVTKENVNQLYILAEPQTGFDFIVNPLTCENQAITSAPMMAAMIVTQDYAHWLTETDPAFASLKGQFRIQFGDMNDGQHRTHQRAGAVDLRSSFINNPGELHPDGPLFMSGAEGFNYEFNRAVMPFMMNIKVMGKQFFHQLIISSKKLERDLMGANRKGDPVAVVDGHHDHLHADADEEFEIPDFFSPAQPIDCNDPSTGGPTEYIQPAPEITLPPTTTEAPTTTQPTTTPDTIQTTETTAPPETTTTVETLSIESLLSDAAKNYKVQDAKIAYDLSVQSVNNGGNLSYEESYGPQIGIGDVYIYLRKAGATHEEAVLLTAISMRETTLRPGAVGDVFRTSDSGRRQPSYGLFQMMDIDGSGGYRDPQANLNPETAAVNALTLARTAGYKHWSSFMPNTMNVMTVIDAVDLSERDMTSRQRRDFQERIQENVIELFDVVENLRPLVDKALQG